MSKLKIADTLSLPLEVVTHKLGFIGTTGSGKTYGASKLAELMWDAHAQFIALDPVGVWYGLRLDKGGKKPSDITVPIFGGLHGDVPLESGAGAMMADLIVDRALSCILDVSQFESDAQKARFAADFADRFFFRKKASPSAVHLFIEECQEFVPENQQRGEERMLHAFVRLQKIGRNFGIGTSYITQRPQDVSKKALNLAQTLFVFRTTGSHERGAIERWIKDKAIEGQDISQELPKLKTGAPHVWSPEWLQLSEVVRIREKRTFNASATPEVGAAAVTRELAPIDLQKIRTEMAATIERAKADDPKELRKIAAQRDQRIRELEAQLAKPAKADKGNPLREGKIGELRQELARYRRALEAALKIVVKVMALDFPIETDEDRKALQQAVAAAVREITIPIEKRVTALTSRVEGIRAEAGRAQTAINQLLEERVELTVHVQKREPFTVAQPAPPRPTPRPSVRGAAESNGNLAPGERRILTAVAQFGEVDRGQLTVLVGYKATARDTYISRLAQKGYVESGQGRVRVTDTGVQALGTDYEPLPTGPALLEFWRGRLAPGECKVLDAVVAAYPNSAMRADIGEQTGYKPTARDTYISRLASRRLVQSDGRGSVKASDELF